jgi:hypothetical protein
MKEFDWLNSSTDAHKWHIGPLVSQKAGESRCGIANLNRIDEAVIVTVIIIERK